MASRPQMLGRTLSHYRLLEEIGAGGMGVVFRARDERLERDVALKVLPAGALADEDARRRFRKEALALSRLNHPNVATIYDFDSDQGIDFLVVEYIPGVSLDKRLASGPLPLGELIRLALLLTEALEAAHQQGVVHRDLKPANLRITPEGRLKVLDFGLAKQMGSAEDVTVTQSSIGPMGTLAYMAPEQLRNESLDARADIWAAGIVLHEMAAGARPFRGNSGFEVSSAILTQPPSPLPSRIPLELQAVIDRCLQKEREQRYRTAGELRAALEAIQSGSTARWQTWRFRALRRPVIATVTALVAVIALVISANIGAIRSRFSGSTASRIESLAVLPLQNLSGDPAQEYFADGMTEALATDLASLQGLKRVIARSSIVRFKGSNRPLPEIARELNVDALVTGAVLRSGERVRLTAQLIEAATERQLWAASYDRDMRDVLTLQDELTRAIAAEIKLQLAPQEQLRLATARPVNPEAYDLYLQGTFHRHKLSREGLDTAERYFQLALDKDPDYALAYVGLASVWATRGDAGFIPPAEAYRRSQAAGMKALALDDSVAEGHVWLGNLKVLYEWDWAGAEREFLRALELGPSSMARFSYADLLVSHGRFDEWRVQAEKYMETDPLNAFNRCFYGWQLVYVGRYDEALRELNRVAMELPELSSAHLGLWGAFYKKRMYDDAIEAAAKFFSLIKQPEIAAELQRVYPRSGYEAAMQSAAEKLIIRARTSHVPATRIARLYAHGGDADRAMAWLEKAYQQRETALVHANVFWDWDTVRDDPRFQDLLRRMKFVPRRS